MQTEKDCTNFEHLYLCFKNYLIILNVSCAMNNTSVTFNGQWGQVFGHLSGLEDGQDDAQLQGLHA